MLSQTVPLNKKFCCETIPSRRRSECERIEPQIAAIDQNPAAVGQVKLGDQIEDRRLAAAGMADQRNRLARLSHKIQVDARRAGPDRRRT